MLLIRNEILLLRFFFQITILTSQPSRKIANQLDAGLQGIDLVSLHQLQVVEISQRAVQEPSRAEWGRDESSSSSGEYSSLCLEIGKSDTSYT